MVCFFLIFLGEIIFFRLFAADVDFRRSSDFCRACAQFVSIHPLTPGRRRPRPESASDICSHGVVISTVFFFKSPKPCSRILTYILTRLLSVRVGRRSATNRYYARPPAPPPPVSSLPGRLTLPPPQGYRFRPSGNAGGTLGENAHDSPAARGLYNNDFSCRFHKFSRHLSCPVGLRCTHSVFEQT